MDCFKLARRIEGYIRTNFEAMVFRGEIQDHELKQTDFLQLFEKRGIQYSVDDTKIVYEARFMGARTATIYITIGALVFAVCHNYDACPDGVNRFILVQPLYALKGGRIMVVGQDAIEMNILIAANDYYISLLDAFSQEFYKR